MIWRQLFDRESCTYTYLLGDEKTKEAILIDPVIELVDRDEELIRELGLNLMYVLNTHVHADHITGSGLLKKRFEGCQSVLGSANSTAVSDLKMKDGETISVGDITLEVRATPGHTAGCVTYVDHGNKAAYTGDTLLIRGCGRTDFQEGSNENLYASVHEKIFTLPEETFLYPAHDYRGRTSTTVKEEKEFNPRLTKDLEGFSKIMDNLNLAYPKKIDVSLPANLVCGLHEVEEDSKDPK